MGCFAVAVHLDLKLHSLWGFGFSVCGNVAVHAGVIGASWIAISGLVLLVSGVVFGCFPVVVPYL